MLPNGVFAAALTPLRDDLSIDHDSFAEHCRWLLANGCDGIAPMGTTGEANSFSVAERIDALDRLIDAGLPPEKLLIGVGCCAVPDTVALTRHALALDVVNVLALPPFYYKNISDDGVYAAFDQIVQRVGDSRLQLYLYHFPQMSGVPINHAVLDRLVKRYPQTVVGMKDSSGDWNNMQTICERFPGFRLYAGTERYLLDVLRAGGVGCISATTNVTCPLAGQVFAKWRAPEADALQRHLTTVRDTIEKYPAIAALKTLTAERTARPSWLNLRPPLVRLAAERATALTADLARIAFVN